MAYRRKTPRGAWLFARHLLAFSASPAQAADQFKQAADGASIECSVSARELTRFALGRRPVCQRLEDLDRHALQRLCGDQRAGARRHLCVGARDLTRRVDQLLRHDQEGLRLQGRCQVEQIPAVQVFITNPAIAKNRAAGTGKARRRWRQAQCGSSRPWPMTGRSKALKSGNPRPFRHGSAISKSSSSPITAAARSPERSSASTIAAASR
jgi:hypothetical protein